MTVMSVLTPPSEMGSANGSDDNAISRPRYSLIVTSDRDYRIEAQKLRYQVFRNEPGFTIPENSAGVDADSFDDYCDHLLVRDELTQQIVGCYRMLPPEGAIAAGGYYTATEFDISALKPLENRFVEMGRACVLPEHRNGTVLALMWAGILHYIQLTGHDWVMGCVSVPMQLNPEDAPGVNVRGVRDFLMARHATPADQRVRPYNPVVVGGKTLDELVSPDKLHVQPLLRGYLRLGASVAGDPNHDPDFAVADFVSVLGLHQVNKRYLDRLQQAAAAMDKQGF